MRLQFLTRQDLGLQEKNNMSRKEVLINSYTGSGVAWLLNFFLELDVLVYRGNSVDDTWDFDGKKYRLRDDQAVLKQWCPVLTEKNEFEFKENIAIKWMHEFPRRQLLKGKIILLTRDGRDTIYSQFKRENIFSNFKEMLAAGIGPFNLNPADTWALMNYSWLNAVKKENLFLIKFEEIKQIPRPVLDNLLNFLEIERDKKSVERAIEASSFERAKKFEKEYRDSASKTQFNLVNRKGAVGEWRGVYTDEELVYFDGFPNSILRELGYDVAGNGDKHLGVDIFRIKLSVCLFKIKSICFQSIMRMASLIKKCLMRLIYVNK
jgi:hypothetical protein